MTFSEFSLLSLQETWITLGEPYGAFVLTCFLFIFCYILIKNKEAGRSEAAI